MKKALILLPVVVMLLSGCEAEGQLLSTGGAATCKRIIGMVWIYAGIEKLHGNNQISNAFSAWCWLPDCFETMNMILGPNLELNATYQDMRDACGICWNSTWNSWQGNPEVPSDIIAKIQEWCDDHIQFRRPLY